MATYTDTGNTEKVETVQGSCDVCKAPLTELVIRGNKSGAVVNRIKLYTVKAGGITCTSHKTNWRAAQALR